MGCHLAGEGTEAVPGVAEEWRGADNFTKPASTLQTASKVGASHPVSINKSFIHLQSMLLTTCTSLQMRCPLLRSFCLIVTQQERKPPRTGFHWPRRSSNKPKQVTDSTPEEGTSAAVAPAAAAATAKHRRVSRKERLPQDMELSTFLTSEEKAEQGEELRTLAVTHGRTQVGPCHQLPPRNLHDQCLHSKTYVLPVFCVVFCRC